MTSDAERCLDIAEFAGLGGGDLYVVTIPGAPWSKQRPRFAGKGAYANRDDQDAELKTATYLRQVVKRPFTGNVGIGCLFFRPNRQRIDVDNLVKHVCDAGNGVLWADDSQCTAVVGILELDVDRPRTVVVIGEHVTTLTRGSNDTAPCQVCGKPVQRTTRMRGHPPKTCSRDCSAKARGYQSLAEPVPCQHCGTPFKRKTKAQRICSEDCRVEWMRGRNQGASEFSRCKDCNAQLAHRRGGRCRNCWRLNLKTVKDPAAVSQLFARWNEAL